MLAETSVAREPVLPRAGTHSAEEDATKALRFACFACGPRDGLVDRFLPRRVVGTARISPGCSGRSHQIWAQGARCDLSPPIQTCPDRCPIYPDLSLTIRVSEWSILSWHRVNSPVALCSRQLTALSRCLSARMFLQQAARVLYSLVTETLVTTLKSSTPNPVHHQHYVLPATPHLRSRRSALL